MTAVTIAALHSAPVAPSSQSPPLPAGVAGCGPPQPEHAKFANFEKYVKAERVSLSPDRQSEHHSELKKLPNLDQDSDLASLPVMRFYAVRELVPAVQ
jgi:hypothetical protein